ncbi:MAG TPA: galactose oxidase-like domain-containing protein [Bryobacteraceae bacterium]|nr:galactose oxidase-like domain-containing protein [Bryobacteraceae bacterium]
MNVRRIGISTLLAVITALAPAAWAQTSSPDPSIYGKWETVIPEKGGGAIGRVLGMQSVHAVLLPSGKVLLASGSSWRNLAPIQFYPKDPNPEAGKGLFNKDEEPFLNQKLKTYYELVNNAGIYDPETNTFYRIPHPVPVPDGVLHFAPNDLFCTGHMHLPNGNVLFAGGTQYYSPFRTGNRSTYIFDWRKELTIKWPDVDWREIPSSDHNPWIFSGFMPRGRWYATLVPLLDGRLSVFGGYVGFDGPDYPEMYMFEMNSRIDFFDPAAFNPGRPQLAWKSVDVKKTDHSPYSTLINREFKVPQDREKECPARCVQDNKYDAFKLYPENYLMPNGRIYLTREGDWVSLRTCDTIYMRKTNKTYWVAIDDNRQNPSIAFAPGPDRPEEISSYGTTFRDPNSAAIRLLGGQPTSPGTYMPMNELAACDAKPQGPTHFAGGLGSRKMETFIPSVIGPGGSWSLDPNFLGNQIQDNRTMHYTIILPTRQILIINGGNYDFYGPIQYPVLLTPIFSNGSLTGYQQRRMSEGVEPRLYHNNAVLLPDGRVWVSGGNSTRATVHLAPDLGTRRTSSGGQPLPDLSLVDLDMYFFRDGPMAKGEKGMLTTPTEDWVAEIYSPPYLFIDGKKRAKILGLQPTGNLNYQYQKEIAGKTYYLIHSGDSFNVTLADLPDSCSTTPALVLIKLPSATHGWQNGEQFFNLQFQDGGRTIRFTAPTVRDANLPPAFYMMFYVACNGKPSEARMVRFDNSATEP